MRKADLLALEPPGSDGAVYEIKGEPVIEIDYGTNWRGDPKDLRHFAWKGSWITYNATDDRWGKEQIGYHTGSSEAQRDFLQRINSNSYSLTGYESEIAYEKRIKSDVRKGKRLTKQVRSILPPLPNGFIPWVKRNASKKNKYFYLFQPLANGYTADRRFETEIREIDDKDVVIVTEVTFGISFYPGTLWDKYYYGCGYGSYGHAQNWWDKKVYQGPVDKNGLLYPGTLDEVNIATRTARYALKELANKKIPLRYGQVAYRCQDNDASEKIAKSGYEGLIKAFFCKYLKVDSSSKELHNVLEVTKAQYKTLRAINGDDIMIQAARAGLKPKELIELNKFGTRNRRENIAKIAPRRLNMTHVMKLLKDATDDEIRTYDDYLNMAGRRGMDIKDEIVYRNKRWREFHDAYVEEFEKENIKKRRKEVNVKFRNIKAKAAEYKEHFGWKSTEYVMLVPKRASDIVDEGRKQHHCVGSGDNYLTKMNDGTSYILFLRKRGEEAKPFYTIEATFDGNILQAYSAYDRKEEWNEVEPVLKEWKATIKKRTKEVAK